VDVSKVHKYAIHRAMQTVQQMVFARATYAIQTKFVTQALLINQIVTVALLVMLVIATSIQVVQLLLILLMEDVQMMMA